MRHSRTQNAFWDVNSKKWRKWCLYHFSYLIILMSYLCSQWKPTVQIKYFMLDWTIYRLFVLNRGWKIDCLPIMIFVCLIDSRHNRINAFWDVNNKKKRKWWLIHFSYLITLMAYLSSQRTPNVQMKYFMFDWSIYTLC
jgi:hypothetical protein